MEKELNEELLEKLVKGEPQQVMSISAADISVSVPDEKGGEQEYIYPQAMPSEAIASTTAANLGIELKPSNKQEFIEKIEEVKSSYIGEAEFNLGIAGWFNAGCKIRRTPQKTITLYKKQQKD